MGIRHRGRALALLVGTALLLMAGCNAAQPALAPGAGTNSDSSAETSEIRKMAQSSLGDRAEVLAHGDLARNGLEQILIVDRASSRRNPNGPDGGDRAANPSAMLIARAAILQKSKGKWSEVLRCDQHLENPNGYLGGSPAARVASWQLQYAHGTNGEANGDSKASAKKSLELQFTPVDASLGRQGSGTGEPSGTTLVVRWNAAAKRYQSMDPSGERYLNELPALETPQSVLNR